MKLSISNSVQNPVILLKRLRNNLKSSLHINSIYILFNTGMTAILGFLFWALVARLYSAEDVGLGSALISAGTLLAFVGSLGFDYSLIRFLNNSEKTPSSLINISMITGTIATLSVSAIFLVGVPLWSPAFSHLRNNPFFTLAFVTFTTAYTLNSFLTAIFMGFRRSKFAFFQNIINNILKLILVAVFIPLVRNLAIFSSWGVSLVISLAIGMFFFLPRIFPGYQHRIIIKSEITKDMVHFSLINYISHGLFALPQWILPIIIVNTIGAEQNAFFYISFGLASMLFAIPGASSISLFVEGSNEISNLRRDLIRSLKFTLSITIPAIIIIILLGDKILLIFGREYSSEGNHLLWFLAPSALPMIITTLFLSIARVERNLKAIFLVTAGIAIGILALSLLLINSIGITGIAVAWLTVHTLVALVLLPGFVRMCKGGLK